MAPSPETGYPRNLRGTGGSNPGVPFRWLAPASTLAGAITAGARESRAPHAT